DGARTPQRGVPTSVDDSLIAFGFYPALRQLHLKTVGTDQMGSANCDLLNTGTFQNSGDFFTPCDVTAHDNSLIQGRRFLFQLIHKHVSDHLVVTINPGFGDSFKLGNSFLRVAQSLFKESDLFGCGQISKESNLLLGGFESANLVALRLRLRLEESINSCSLVVAGLLQR